MQAVGTDLEHLCTVEDFLFVRTENYMRNLTGAIHMYIGMKRKDASDMLLASRIKGAGALRGGCTALCRSKDLMHWTY